MKKDVVTEMKEEMVEKPSNGKTTEPKTDPGLEVAKHVAASQVHCARQEYDRLKAEQTDRMWQMGNLSAQAETKRRFLRPHLDELDRLERQMVEHYGYLAESEKLMTEADNRVKALELTQAAIADAAGR